MNTEVVEPGVPTTAPSSGGLIGVLRGVALIIALFLGYKVVPFYYYYYDLKSYFAQVIREAEGASDDDIRAKVLAMVRQHGIGSDARDIRVQRIGNRIKVWVDYHESLDVWVAGKRVTLFTFAFSPSAERVFDE
jgi:hypothetical protein